MTSAFQDQYLQGLDVVYQYSTMELILVHAVSDVISTSCALRSYMRNVCTTYLLAFLPWTSAEACSDKTCWKEWEGASFFFESVLVYKLCPDV